MPTSPSSRPLFSQCAIGLDTSGDEPLVCSVQFLSGKAHVTCLPLAEAAGRLRRRLADGRHCAAALPPTEGLAIRLDPPDLPPAKRRRVLPSLLDLQLPFALHECSYTFVEQSGDTLALAVRLNHLEAELARLRELGFNPARIQPLGWVLWTQSLRELAPGADDEKRAIVWTMPRRWVVATGQGTGFGSVFTVPPQDFAALGRMLQMAFGSGVDACRMLCGGVAADAAAQGLSAADGKIGASAKTLADPVYFLARALAYDAALDRTGRLHLRQAPLQHPALAGAEQRFAKCAAGLLLVLALALAGTAAAVRFVANQREKHLSSELALRFDQLAGYHVTTRGTGAVQEVRVALEERLDPLVKQIQFPSTSAALATVLTAAGQEGIEIGHLALEQQRPTLSGRAPSQAAARSFVQTLQQAGLAVRMELEAAAGKGDACNFLITPEGSR